MQANTAGDEYSWALTESDGTTPFLITGVTSVAIAIAGPYATNLLAEAASATSGIEFSADLTNSPPTISWITTIAGNDSAQVTTYPVGGYYPHQAVLNYSDGNIAKSRVFILQILDSIA